MPQVVPHQHARDPGIPQASVRPLVRPVNQSPERLDRLDRIDRGERMDRMDRIERMDRMDRMDRMERMKREMDRYDSESKIFLLLLGKTGFGKVWKRLLFFLCPNV